MTRPLKPAAWFLLLLIPLVAVAQQTLKVDVNLVNVFIAAQGERGEFISDLKREDFAVYDDGQPQQISIFEKDRDVRSAIAILLDTSGSSVDILPYERRGLIDFAKT